MVVISKALNDKLYQGANSVGRDLRMEGQSYRIVGVMKEWSPEPHFYDLTTGSYGKNEDLLLPISTSFDLKLGSNGNMNCFGENPDGNSYSLNAPCAWLQYWVEMDPAKAADYRRYLENYSSQQRQAGRFKHPPNVRLRTVMEWLDFNGAVPSDVRLQLWLALGFLGVCLVNTVGLLLAKFLRRSGEIGVRRALGASRGQIFLQCLVEAGAVGVVGGVLGIGLALLGLFAVRQQPVEYAKLAHLDGNMLLLALGLTLFASLAAGFLPAGAPCRSLRPSSSSRSKQSNEDSHGHPPHPQHAAPAQDCRCPDRAGSRTDLRHRLQRAVPGQPARGEDQHAQRHRRERTGDAPRQRHRQADRCHGPHP